MAWAGGCEAVRKALFLTRRREGAKKTNVKKNGGMSCRSAAIHAADIKDARWLGGWLWGCPEGFISYAKAMWRNVLRALHSLAVVLRAAPCVFFAAVSAC